MGVERSFPGAGLFDAVIPRAGMAYTFSLAREQLGDTIVHFPMTACDMRLNAGIGFRKNLFCLDLFVNIGAWNGVLAGPRTMAATLTVGLSEKFLGE